MRKKREGETEGGRMRRGKSWREEKEKKSKSECESEIRWE